MSPKTAVLALKMFLRRPDAFPDKSGPTEPTQPGRRGLVPEDASAGAEDVLRRPDAFPDESGPTGSLPLLPRHRQPVSDHGLIRAGGFAQMQPLINKTLPRHVIARQ